MDSGWLRRKHLVQISLLEVSQRGSGKRTPCQVRPTLLGAMEPSFTAVLTIPGWLPVTCCTTLYPCNNTTAYPKPDLPITARVVLYSRQLLRLYGEQEWWQASKEDRHPDSANRAATSLPVPSAGGGAVAPRWSKCWHENLKPIKWGQTQLLQVNLLLNFFPCKMGSSFLNHWLELFIHSLVCFLRRGNACSRHRF